MPLNGVAFPIRSVIFAPFMARSRTPKAYAAAGVDIDLGNKVKSSIPKLIAATHRPEVLSKIGAFGGLFRAKFPRMQDPVLVSSVDGVGTKLKVASAMKRHDTIGADLVNHCINDIAVLGAEPLFFLDYIGTGRLDPDVFKQILTGLATACKASKCALIGGETAQMPGVYHGDDYDLVGTIVGVVDRPKIIDGTSIRPGDVVIGLASSGLHTNGYTLARSVLFDKMRLTLDSPVPGSRQTLGELLLAPHINYQPLLKKLGQKVKIKGLAHITGGGFVDNIPRILPRGTGVTIQAGTWDVPPIFQLLASGDFIPTSELYQVFNMGIGMVVVVSSKDAPKALALTGGTIIGQVTKGNRTVKIEF
jgi:phosphoribosylformylglycinamidine cyclo-ligase